MALSERPQIKEPSPAPNTLDRGGESAAPKRITAIDMLKKEKFMGVPKIIALPLLLLMTAANAGVIIYNEVPPVHRALDKAWNASLEAFGLKEIK